MDSGKISGTNLIYSQTGFACEKQITDVIEKILTKANIDTDFYVNVVYNKGNICGHSYIWVTNPTAFKFLVDIGNKGYGGVKKYIQMENPDYQNEPINITSSDSWADGAAQFIQVEMTEEVPLEKIKATPDQLKLLESNKKWVSPFTVTFHKAHVEDIRLHGSSDSEEEEEQDRLIHNVLIATGIPDFLKMTDILDAVKKFNTVEGASGPFGVQKNGKEKILKYPHISIKNGAKGRNVFVTFNENSTDGMFAIHMCKQLKITSGGRVATLYFNHYLKRAKNE